MGLKLTTEGALRIVTLIIAVTGMAALVALIFEKLALGAAMALVAVLGCLAAILIIRDEDNKNL